MWNLSLLILLILNLYFWLKAILHKRLVKIRDRYYTTQNEYNGLLNKNGRLKVDNANLGKIVNETVALYNITKEVCKYLDVNKTIDSCKDQMAKYIGVSDCDYVAGAINSAEYRDYAVFPLEIGKRNIGYFVANGIKKQDEDKFSILAHQFILGIKRAHLYQKVQELAITDSLTGVFGRRYFLERFNEEIERSRKFGYSFSFLMVDVDHFKEYNDHYGHLVGDAILKEVSKTIKENIRQIDLLGRYGGEEFSIILTETDREEAILVAGRIRQAIETRHIRVYDEALKITISIGISGFPSDAQHTTELIEKADQALYQAKEKGRNMVCVYGA